MASKKLERHLKIKTIDGGKLKSDFREVGAKIIGTCKVTPKLEKNKNKR